MGQKMLLLLSVSVISFFVTPHEFWLEPNRFYFKPGEDAVLNFRVGENFLGEVWKVTADRVVRLERHSGKQVHDLINVLKEDTADPFHVALTNEGSHLLVMETNTAFSKLDGTQFTAYLEDDGLDEILYQRQKAGIGNDSATELYSRHIKTILQVGQATDETFRKICNLPLEIIPENNPATLKKGNRIAFKILFHGKPLFGAKVKVWNRFNHRTSVQNIFSQQDGMIETHVSNPGVWMVSVVKMVSSDDPKAQYRSYCGSLVFGVQQ